MMLTWAHFDRLVIQIFMYFTDFYTNIQCICKQISDLFLMMTQKDTELFRCLRVREWAYNQLSFKKLNNVNPSIFKFVDIRHLWICSDWTNWRKFKTTSVWRRQPPLENIVENSSCIWNTSWKCEAVKLVWLWCLLKSQLYVGCGQWICRKR